VIKFELLYYNLSGILLQASRNPMMGTLPQTTVTILVVLLLLLMVFSFIISGAEVAYFSLSYKEINVLKAAPLGKADT
jgi:putative hemolysin